jgi:hypothetical protein
MSDITKCYNPLCKIKNECYRFTAKDSNSRQSYSFFPNGITRIAVIQKKECEYYWDNK